MIEKVLNDLRSNGWSVAVHNDYVVKDQPMTFWLFTHKTSGLFVKGEGSTDIDALEECERQAMWWHTR